MKRTRKAIVALVLLAAVIFMQGIAGGTSAATVEPKEGGTLRMAVEAEPQHIDPHLAQSNLVTSIVDLTYDYLWRWDHEFTDFIPDLAESWEWVNETEFKVTLRQGATFHSGREVKAEDVIYSVNRILDPMTGSPNAGYLSPIDELEVTSDYELVIKLKDAWFGLQDVFSRNVAIVDKDIVEEFGDLKTNDGGSGPFELEKWTPGYGMEFTKYTDYWMEGRPYLDGVELRFMPEYNTAKNALLSDEIDIINWPDSADLRSLQSNEDIVLHYYDTLAIMYININTAEGPLADAKVRKAISLATDRDAYNNALYMGAGSISWSPILAGQPYAKSEWEHEPDIEQAKALLAEAGYEDGFEIEILALKGAEEIMGEVLQADLNKIGITSNVNIAEIPIALDAIFTKEDFDIAVLGDAVSPDPDFFVSNYLIPTGSAAGATGRWSNDRVIELAAEGKVTLDIEDRIEIYQELYDIVLEEAPMVYLAFPVRHPASNKTVQGWFAWSDIRYDWRNVWLDK